MKKLFCAIAFLFALSGCGTDTGNPGLTSPVSGISGDFIGYELCGKVTSCFGPVSQNCSSLIGNAANLTAALGISAVTYPVLNNAISAVAAGTLSLDTVQRDNCVTAFKNLSCNDPLVTASFDSSQPQQLDQVFRLLSASGTCQNMLH